jgi:hypothetical protein
VGGLLLIAVLIYVGFYWRGLASMDRYDKGFIIETCPVCKQGHLTVETRADRFLGIPRPRSVVRCTHCRSLLREVGKEQWRYAVDGTANPRLYQQLNGRTVDEATLLTLSQRTTRPIPPADAPKFVDDEE